MIFGALVIDVLFIGLGALMRTVAFDPNPAFGYRTTRSMQSPEAWAYANRKSGSLMIVVGLVSLAFSLMATALDTATGFTATDAGMMAAAGIYMILPLVGIWIVLMVVERDLKKRFSPDAKPARNDGIGAEVGADADAEAGADADAEVGADAIAVAEADAETEAIAVAEANANANVKTAAAVASGVGPHDACGLHGVELEAEANASARKGDPATRGRSRSLGTAQKAVFAILCLLPLVVAACGFPAVPDTVAVHFDASGADGWAPKAQLFLFAGIMAASNVVIAFAYRVFLHHQAQARNASLRSAPFVAFALCMLVASAAVLYVILYNVGFGG